MKELVNDINETLMPRKSELSAKTKIVFGISVIGAIAAGVLAGMRLAPTKVVEVKSTLPPAPISNVETQVEPEKSIDTVSNVVTDDVIYVEYLEPTSNHVQSLTSSLSEDGSTVEVGSFKVSFEDKLQKTSYPDIYMLGDSFVYIGDISNSGQLVNAFVESEEKELPFLEELTVIPQEFMDAASNFSMQGIDTYVWQKHITLGDITGYQTMVVFNSNCVGFINPYQFEDDLARDIVAQISKTVPIQSYKLLDQTVDTFYNFKSLQFIAPSGLHVQDMGTFSQLDMGESLSHNKLFMSSIPIDSIDSSLLTQVELILASSGYSTESKLKIAIDTNATWLNRTARYIEYAYGTARVCAYAFPNRITNEATVFFVAEQDNKFPYMLRYLNTLASEIGDF